MSKISIIIPVIREESYNRCVDAINLNAGIPAADFEIVSEYDEYKIGCPAMVQKLTRESKHDLVMFLGDDTIPEKDFLRHALDAMDILPDGWGVVGLNTQDIRVPGGNPIAHWMAHKKMLDIIPGGDFFSPEYKHCWCDDELKDIADEQDRWVWAKKSRITHVHPVNKSADFEDGYQIAYSNDNMDHDFKIYCRRKRVRMVDRFGIKLAIAIPLTDPIVYNQFFFSFVKVITEYMSGIVKKGNPISFEVLMPDFPGQIDAVRNDLVNQALKLGCSHILMMDSDQIYNSDNLIEKMLSHGKPVVGARVHRRYPPFDPLLLEGDVGELRQIPDEKIRDKDGNFTTELKVDYTGTGCILYDTDIFIDMIPEKWFELKTGDKGQPIGEDIAFCDKLKKRNIPIIVDCSIDIKHLTIMAADWGTHKLFQKLILPKKTI